MILTLQSMLRVSPNSLASEKPASKCPLTRPAKMRINDRQEAQSGRPRIRLTQTRHQCPSCEILLAGAPPLPSTYPELQSQGQRARRPGNRRSYTGVRPQFREMPACRHIAFGSLVLQRTQLDLEIRHLPPPYFDLLIRNALEHRSEVIGQFRLGWSSTGVSGHTFLES